jgi:3,4-dihydroxy 2-butanone 4-phosphate synthase/GTP cyclohydrolase II
MTTPTPPTSPAATDPVERVSRALDEIRAGRMVILVDDEDRENEGDLVMAADRVTPEAINFMATHARGLICLPMADELIDRLELPMMVRDNRAPLGTAFTVSIEARQGVTTGISARDRAHTVQVAIADGTGPADVVSPGHVFPLRARRGGVLVRTGQTEGSVDLARMAGCKPAGVICEIMRDDGEMARMPELEVFAAKHGLMILSVADMIAYRLQRERIVRPRAHANLRPGSLPPGEPFAVSYYEAEVEETEYVAWVRGDLAAAAASDTPVLVRVATLDPLADPFAIRPELDAALRMIDDAGLGVLLYVYNRSRTRMARSFERLAGPGAAGLDPARTPSTASDVLRDFGLGAQVLVDLGCHKVRLLTHRDRRIPALEGFGLDLVERVPIPARPGLRWRGAGAG